MNLLIYNPDTDYALASGSDFYTPPASVKALMADNPYMAGSWGEVGDLILVNDDVPISSSISREQGFEIIKDTELRQQEDLLAKIEGIKPWGWNPALRHRLLEIGISPDLMPSSEKIAALRSLAHRRTTIDFLRYCGWGTLPKEIFTEEEGIGFWNINRGCWFKAPWSSSGRGVLPTLELEERHIRPWIRGIIRRQGSVMAEVGMDKKIDFATEWEVNSNMVEFVGLSLFKVSGRGKFKGNIDLTQEEIREYLDKESGGSLESIIQKQKSAISALLSNSYTGPLGIDLMIDREGKINPCVEINLRRTMGHVYLSKQIKC